jgi:hypothetical protein
MKDRLPDKFRIGARSRRPFPPGGYEELVAMSLEERRSQRLAELNRATGRVDLPVPPPPEGLPPHGAQSLPPASEAQGGSIKVVRGAWIAKYDPKRAEREQLLNPMDRSVDNSDVFTDVAWADPGRAVGEPWIHSWLMRGASAGIPAMDVGDLVFPVRTAWKKTDAGWLRHRTVVGVWFVDATASWPEKDTNGRTGWYSEAATLPLRRFDFPVPIEATADIDPAFDTVAAFHDRSRKALIELSPDESLAVTRACGLPAAILTEPDPNRLAPILRGLDLGPPVVVRKRILDGARAAAHRSSVEKAARDAVVAHLQQVRMGVVSTELERGLGSDLWARAIEADGSLIDVRIEVKGLSGKDPWQARLTQSELDAARADRGRGSWWLVIVTRALRTDRVELWLTSTEAAQIFTVLNGHGHYTADRVAAGGL